LWEPEVVLYESLNDALIDCVKACGGSKSIGVEIWPAKGVEGAQRHLLACLNPDRNEKLSPDEVLLIARLARDKGCHIYMQYLAQALSYSEPEPKDPEDELKELIKQQNELSSALLASRQRIEKALQRIEPGKANLREVA
jgi:hypothetical protein